MSFFENLSFGQYVPAESPIHRLDPRAKILALILLLTGLFMASRPQDWGLWCLVLVAVSYGSSMKLSFLVRSIRPVIFLVVFTAALNLFLAPGEALWRWGILSISREGLSMAWTMSLRLILLVLFANLLTLTTSPMSLADGLESLLSPLKRFGFPAHELAMMMTIALRFIPTLLGETDRIIKAQLARGADLDRGSLLARLKAFLPVLIPLFVMVFQRAEDLAVAMEARCYRGGEGRSRMNPFHWALQDSLALACCLGILTLQRFLPALGA